MRRQRDEVEDGVRQAQPLGASLLQLEAQAQGMEVSDVRAMAEEISRLKRIAADQVVQIDMLSTEPKPSTVPIGVP